MHQLAVFITTIAIMALQVNGHVAFDPDVRDLVSILASNLPKSHQKDLGTLWNHGQKSYLRFNAHAPYTFLLLGETGSGKTFTLDFLCGFNELSSILDPSMSWRETVSKLISVRIKHPHENSPNKSSSKSNTFAASRHHCHFLQYAIDVIDTPGFGDTSGVEVDEKNINSIMEAVRNIDYINAVLIVMNGASNKETASLRYALTQLQANLPIAITKATVVIWTHVESKADLDFSRQTLHKLLGFAPSYEWYFMNPMALVTRDAFDILDEKTEASGRNRIAVSVRDMIRLFGSVAHLEPVPTHVFTKLHESRQEVVVAMMRASEHVKNLATAQVDRKRVLESLSNANTKKEAAKNFEFTKKGTNWKLKDTQHHNTLCAAPECHHNCHEHCGLPFKMEKGHAIFKGCAAMDSNGICKVCGHSWEEHQHLRMMWWQEPFEHHHVDPAIKDLYDKATSEAERIAILVAAVEKQIHELDAQLLEALKLLGVSIRAFDGLAAGYGFLHLLQTQQQYLEQLVRAPSISSAQSTSVQEMLELVKLNIDIILTNNITQTVNNIPTVDNRPPPPLPKPSLWRRALAWIGIASCEDCEL